MIRSLYVRITLTFLIIVVISMFIAYIMANQLFRRDMRGQFGMDMSNTINRIEQLYNVSSPRSLPAFLKGVSEFQGVTIVAVNSNARVIGVGGMNQLIMDYLTIDTLQRVFDGNTETISLGEAESNNTAARNAIGQLVTFGNNHWALFVVPDRAPQIRSFQRNTYTILITLLVVGSILILIAARYLVKPLKLMTAATTRIAKGDFAVQLKVKRKDEMGDLANSINQMSHSLSKIELMRQDFVSNVSHEIQSPLTSIGGFAEALRSEEMSVKDRNRYVGIIKQESDRLSRLSENLLKLASLDSDHHPFVTSTFRLDRQLRDSVLFCEPHWLAKRLTVELLMEETVITADEDQLSQVWINLLTNSMKFTPEEGKISFHLTEQDGYAVVRIADTGIGIPPEERERVFERFYKSDVSRDRTQGGSGLGLSIVKKIIDIHGGTIEIEETNEYSQGAVFIVRLPLCSNEEDE